MLIGGVVLDGVDMLLILIVGGQIGNLVVTLMTTRWICKLLIELCGGKEVPHARANTNRKTKRKKKDRRR